MKYVKKPQKTTPREAVQVIGKAAFSECPDWLLKAIEDKRLEFLPQKIKVHGQLGLVGYALEGDYIYRAADDYVWVCGQKAFEEEWEVAK